MLLNNVLNELRGLISSVAAVYMNSEETKST
jgi:hypothetical protein